MDRYLSGFLENVISQKNFTKKIELVIELNKPSIYAERLLKSYGNKYKKNFVILKTSKLKGLYSSWNTCIKKANGSYLAIWNVDDRRTPNSLDIQSKLLFKKNISFAYGNFNVVSSHDNKNARIKLIDISKLSSDELNKSMIIGPFFMFKKNVVKKIGYFDEKLKSASDFDFALRLANQYKGSYTKKNLGYYLDEGKGLSTSKRIDTEFETDFIYFRYGIRKKNALNFHKKIKSSKNNIYFYEKFGKRVKLENDFTNLKKLQITNKFKYKRKFVDKYAILRIFKFYFKKFF